KDAQQGTLDFGKYNVLNMLNVKYVVYGAEAQNIIPNAATNGAAWFVKSIMKVNSPAEELKQTTLVNTREIAVINEKLWQVDSPVTIDSTASVSLLEHTPPYLKYESQSTVKGVVVFSEIYYPKGWHAFIDGNEVPIMQADYVLRALEVPEGKHTIEFKFEPKPYVIGNKVTMASGWLLLLIVLGAFGWSFKNE
ncbi:MAG: YfhO family protein, partial [Cyclobacteriaceae bacterium]|nr:YfhO family protein [Cyclobacteriaceae bacterium]